ncbi:MAG: hypothetical protein RLZZ210_1716 [Pseudomonadota bacterium]|jgi:mRNA interferase MazF
MQININRGDIFWANLNPTVGSEINKLRPVAILSVNSLNKARNTVIIIPLSTSAKEVKFINVGLTGGSIARCDQIRTIDKSRLKNKLGELYQSDLEKISQAIKVILGL